jgi:transposase
VKRQKNDAIDAEAICEAAQRPSMRFVAVKSEQQQAAGLVFRTRDLLVRQRTQLINAIRGHLTEYGWVAPKGTVACGDARRPARGRRDGQLTSRSGPRHVPIDVGPARRPRRQDSGISTRRSRGVLARTKYRAG